jgi:hypothetical protein
MASNGAHPPPEWGSAEHVCIEELARSQGVELT